MSTFDAAAAGLGEVLIQALRSHGYGAPTPIQAQAWPIALAGQDMVAVAMTGSGKTVGFLLPILARIAERGPAPKPKRHSWVETDPAAPSAVVVAPTRELVLQIAEEAQKFASEVGAHVVSIYGGVDKAPALQELRQGADIVIATPGRLLDFGSGSKDRGKRPPLTFKAVTYLVLDEADRMLDLGFEPDVRKIVALCPKSGEPNEGGGATGVNAASKRQTLFFTATWPKSVQRIAGAFTSPNAVQVLVSQGATGDKLAAATSVIQTVLVLKEGQKLERLRQLLTTELHKNETAIVFGATKNRTEFLKSELNRTKMWCDVIHSGKGQSERRKILDQFRDLSSGNLEEKRGILVATDVASRGLHIPGVSLVVIYDFMGGESKEGIDAYVHKIGRTGRAGKPGRAVTFFTPNDWGAKKLVRLLKDSRRAVPQALENLAAAELPKEDWLKRRIALKKTEIQLR
eukprot:gnl/TRDRNA2_/TRDRNA2_92090_c0_seq1.p1 gnl/TRDRNA2_/TRDRNA2_92090_c0~~gnl/TRDRNA2_/TRDRNA2_92090_c0_seq1.p1  ORF type:complete len:491 (+),score=64.42 gnl/TRDRNA2_/TRDRNA2_92090_c0_seq1:99-1475(+)